MFAVTFRVRILFERDNEILKYDRRRHIGASVVRLRGWNGKNELSSSSSDGRVRVFIYQPYRYDFHVSVRVSSLVVRYSVILAVVVEWSSAWRVKCNRAGDNGYNTFP